MKQLQEVITSLEYLQRCGKDPFDIAATDITDFIRHDLQRLIDGLKDLQNGLLTKNDHSGNCSH